MYKLTTPSPPLKCHKPTISVPVSTLVQRFLISTFPLLFGNLSFVIQEEAAISKITYYIYKIGAMKRAQCFSLLLFTRKA